MSNKVGHGKNNEVRTFKNPKCAYNILRTREFI